jgi:hypothetical protein
MALTCTCLQGPTFRCKGQNESKESTMRFSHFIATTTLLGFSGVSLPASAFAQETTGVHGTPTTLKSTDPRAQVQQQTGVSDVEIETQQGAGWGTATNWSPICLAPCDRALDARALYRIAGEGVTPSAAFQIPATPNGLTLDVHAGSRPARAAGFGLGLAGLAGVLFGVTMFAAAAATEPPTTGPFAQPFFASTNASRAQQAATMQVLGVIGLAAGVVGLAVGIPLVALNGTSVQMEPTPAPALN